MRLKISPSIAIKLNNSSLQKMQTPCRTTVDYEHAYVCTTFKVNHFSRFSTGANQVFSTQETSLNKNSVNIKAARSDTF